MNRREFLKSTATLAALASVARLAGEEASAENSDKNSQGSGPQVTRRPYKNTKMTLPLLGFGLMRLPQKDGKVDYATAEAMVKKAMMPDAIILTPPTCITMERAKDLSGKSCQNIRAKVIISPVKCRL